MIERQFQEQNDEYVEPVLIRLLEDPMLEGIMKIDSSSESDDSGWEDIKDNIASVIMEL